MIIWDNDRRAWVSYDEWIRDGGKAGGNRVYHCSVYNLDQEVLIGSSIC